MALAVSQYESDDWRQEAGLGAARPVLPAFDCLAVSASVGLVREHGAPHTVEIIHCSTLCSEGIRGADDQLHSKIKSYFEELQLLGVGALYLVGVYRPSVFSGLIMPHFAEEWPKKPENPAHVGPSVFAVEDLVPAQSIGDWANLKFLSQEAQNFGINLVVDFIPNTIGLDSKITRLAPELISDAKADHAELERLRACDLGESGAGKVKFQGTALTETDGGQIRHVLRVLADGDRRELISFRREEPEDVSYQFYLQRDLKKGFSPHFWLIETKAGNTTVHCKELGRDTGSGVVWADVARLKTWDTAVQDLQVAHLAHLSKIVPIVRADMSHLPGQTYWQSLLERARDQSADLPQIWGEAYGYGKHTELGTLGIKSYANWIKEWLRAGEVEKLMAQIYGQPRDIEFLKNNAIVYSANHDDSRGDYNLVEGAISAILTALPVPVVMFAQGQRFGDHHRYGADQHVPWEDFDRRSSGFVAADPEYAKFMVRLISLAGCAVFRSENSDCLPVYLHTIGKKDEAKVFHVARKLAEERVLAVVDFQSESLGSSIEVNLEKTFGLTENDLKNYELVNLLDGRMAPAQSKVNLAPAGTDIGYNTYFYWLRPLATVSL